jgi:hypothetical protein
MEKTDIKEVIEHLFFYYSIKYKYQGEGQSEADFEITNREANGFLKAIHVLKDVYDRD